MSNASRTLLLNLTVADKVSRVGSKAFNLGQLTKRGLPTPGGFVVPDGVFQQHLERADVNSAIDALLERLDGLSEQAIASAGAAIRERIIATDLAGPLRAALADVGGRQWRDRPLAVRSSAVGEDSATTSFAGQLDSFLNVAGEPALETALRATWASLFSQRVLLYARHHQLRPRHMGVIVQPQVNARFSGVLFTRDPCGGGHADTMLLEYCAGLGEAVVGGRVTPSRLRIDRGDLTLTPEHGAGDADALDSAAEHAIRQISRWALELEAAEGAPQDLEWCVDAGGLPVIVQARPATQRVAAPPGGRVHWSNANIAENFPEPVSPFLFSIVKPGYSAYFRNLGRGFGVSRRRLAAVATPLDDIVGLQGGHLYYNLTHIHALLQMMPGGRRLVEYFNLFVGAEAIPAPPPLPLGILARAAETLRIAVCVLWQYVFIARRVRRFEARVDRFAAATRPVHLPEKSIAELSDHLGGFLTIRVEQWNDAALADTAAMVCYGLLKAHLARSLGDADQTALHNDLLKGLPGLASAEPVTQLWALADRIRRQPALRALFTDSSAETILARLDDDDCREFKHAFTDYLERWGFRSSGELMLTTPTPQEDPLPVLRLLKSYVGSQAMSPQHQTRVQQRAREAATAALAAHLSPPGWRSVPLLSQASRFRLLLAATQGAIKLRERARMKQALLYTRLRHIALQLGARLTERGLLQQPDDIFLLTLPEVRSMVAGAAADLAPAIESRRQEQQAFSACTPPDRIVLGPGEQWQPDEADQHDEACAAPTKTLRGNGACGGAAAGEAAVVLDVAYADRVQDGQILVTRQTDPGWATVFFLVRGLVIERGGMLSHGAIIAREYGIPAVVGVPEATRLIRDGDRVRVDGDQGLVELNT